MIVALKSVIGKRSCFSTDDIQANGDFGSVLLALAVGRKERLGTVADRQAAPCVRCRGGRRDPVHLNQLKLLFSVGLKIGRIVTNSHLGEPERQEVSTSHWHSCVLPLSSVTAHIPSLSHPSGMGTPTVMGSAIQGNSVIFLDPEGSNASDSGLHGFLSLMRTGTYLAVEPSQQGVEPSKEVHEVDEQMRGDFCQLPFRADMRTKYKAQVLQPRPSIPATAATFLPRTLLGKCLPGRQRWMPQTEVARAG